MKNIEILSILFLRIKDKLAEKKIFYPNINIEKHEQLNNTFTPIMTKTCSLEKNRSNESQIDNFFVSFPVSNSFNNSTTNATPFLFEKFESNFISQVYF